MGALLLDTFPQKNQLYTTHNLDSPIAGMAFLEGKRGSDVFDEWKSKVLPTFVLGSCFWIPAQSANFRLVPPKYRVTVIGCLTFVELNCLCLFRRIDLKF